MKYIIMAGGHYAKWDSPRHLVTVQGEPVIARTIRLLRDEGVQDISVSSDNPAILAIQKVLGVPILTHQNDYYAREYNDMDGYWCNCFYPTDEPTCYLFGDVVFSPAAIHTIVTYQTDDIMLFGSKPPFAPEYPKEYIEPFAFKVADTEHLKQACCKVKELDRAGAFNRKPIAWETWNVIHDGDPNIIDCNSYVGINDYTCDIDNPEEIEAVLASISDTERGD